MKPLGAVMLILAGLAWGLGRSRELGRRVARLTDLQKLIQWLRTEISYSARPLAALVEHSDNPFCREAVQLPGFYGNPREALAQAGDRLLADERDRALFRGLANGLGASDTQGQLEHLQLYMALTGDSLEEARTACRDKQRLYVGMGLLVGIGVCIVVV